MRTTADLAHELRTLPRGALFAIPALSPEERLRIDEQNPKYLTAIDSLRDREMPLTRAAALALLQAAGYPTALEISPGTRVNLVAGPGEMIVGREGNGLKVAEDGRTMRFQRPHRFTVPQERTP